MRQLEIGDCTFNVLGLVAGVTEKFLGIAEKFGHNTFHRLQFFLGWLA